MLSELSAEIEAIETEITEARVELAEEQSKTVGTEALQAQVAGVEAEIKTCRQRHREKLLRWAD